jgi:poly(3-hydroxybutyrate) depolymerase
MKRGCAHLALALCAAASGSARSAQSVTLPAWVCAHPDAIFAGGFETGEIAVPHSPSNGSGGLYPGNRTRSITVAGLGTQNYYLYLPSDYTPVRPSPLMVVLHGAAGPGNSESAAQTTRTDWSALAQSAGFIVAAPAGSGSQGGWIAPDINGQGPSDYDAIAAVLTDIAANYNIETTREYAWGFSAGGITLYDIILTGWSGIDADTFAGFAVTGATLAACLPYSTVASCVPANAARTIPLDIHAGVNDTTIPVNYPRNDKTAFLNAGWVLGGNLFYTEFTDGNPPGGHTYTTAHLGDTWHNLCPNAVTP